jgi:hypothetical protein
VEVLASLEYPDIFLDIIKDLFNFTERCVNTMKNCLLEAGVSCWLAKFNGFTVKQSFAISQLILK